MKITMSQIIAFEERFRYFYNDIKNNNGEINLGELLLITTSSYCEVVSNGNKDLENKLEDEFYRFFASEKMLITNIEDELKKRLVIIQRAALN